MAPGMVAESLHPDQKSVSTERCVPSLSFETSKPTPSDIPPPHLPSHAATPGTSQTVPLA